MADNILRLKVESSEYDAKLKKAAEGIRHLADVAHKSGGDLTGLEKAELDYIKALGEMETKSRSAAGQVRELESTYKELKVIYDQLNDVEKADEGGKALAASLEQLKQRAQDAKKSLDDASKSLQQNEDSAKEDSGALEKLASKFVVNVDALKLFNIGLQAAGVALDVAKDAFFASEANVDEWGRTVQSAQSVYEGFLISINNGDISGFLSRMDDIVKAARAAYNELDTLGTMETIQAPQISKQQLENERIRSMIQTGRYIAPQDGRKNAVFNGREMQTGDKLTAGQIRAMEKQLQGGMQKMVKLVGNEVDQTGKAINAYYNSMAKQNGMSLQEFKKGTSTWEEFNKKIQGYEEYKKWDAQARTEFAKQGGRGNVDFDKNNPFAEFKKWGVFRVDKEGGNSYKDLVQLIQQRDQKVGQVYSTQAQAYRTMNRAEGVTVRQIMGGTGGKGGKTDKNLDDEQKVQQKINDLLKEALTADANRQGEIRQQVTELQKQQEKYKDIKNLAQGILPKDRKAVFTIDGQLSEDTKKNLRNIENVTIDDKTMTVTANTQEALQKVQELVADIDGKVVNMKVVPVITDEDIDKQLQRQYGKAIQVPITPKLTAGEELVQSIRVKLAEDNINADMQTLRTLLETQIKNGIEGIDIPTDMLMQAIIGEGLNIPDKYWKNLQEQINEKLKEMGLDQLDIDFKTGESNKKDKKEKSPIEGSKQLVSGLSQVTSGLKAVGVELPKEVDQVLGVINGVSQIISGVGTIISIFGTTAITSNTTAVGLNTAAIGGLIAALEFNSATNFFGFANGGIVPHAANGYFVGGNSFSGDNTPIMANAGELVLSKSQQGVLASMLTDGDREGVGGSSSLPYVDGETIYLGLKNYLMRSGRGEIVTTRR